MWTFQKLIKTMRTPGYNFTLWIVLPHSFSVLWNILNLVLSISGAALRNQNPSPSSPIQDLLQQKVSPVAPQRPLRLRVRLPGLLAGRPRARQGRLVPHRDRQTRAEICPGEIGVRDRPAATCRMPKVRWHDD